MAETLQYTISATAQEAGDAYDARVEQVDQSGAKVLSYSDRRRITLAPAASAVDIFHTGAGTLAAANLEFLILVEYDANSTIANRLVTFTRDTVAVEARTFAAFSCDTSLTVTNNDATYGVVLEVLAFVRTA